MAGFSTKENKNIYHRTRESLQLTREAASLNSMMSAAEREQAQTKSERDALVLEASL